METGGCFDCARKKRTSTDRAQLLVFGLIATLFILTVDMMTGGDGPVAFLYGGVILLLGPLGRRFTVAVGIALAALACTAFCGGHIAVHDLHNSEAALFAVTLLVIGTATLLSIWNQTWRTTLAELARTLELSHDTVIINDQKDLILYWNDGAEILYGWSRQEALGRSCQELLRTEFPEAEVWRALELRGQWSGDIVRTRRDGNRLILATRWVLRRDVDGRQVGVIESSADLTEQRRADLLIKASEQRYREIFDSAGFAIWESDWTEAIRISCLSRPTEINLRDWLAGNPEIVNAVLASATICNANEAAAILWGAASREALVGLNWNCLFMDCAIEPLAGMITALDEGATRVECEVQARALDGRVLDLVLRISVSSADAPWSNLLIMAADVTERNDARRRAEHAHAERAHEARVSMLGQLASSIAHEVNQPLTAIINYGKSAKRFLDRPKPDLRELDVCLEKILSNSTRASDVVARVRGLARKTSPETTPLNLVELIDETIGLIQREAQSHSVTIVRPRSSSIPTIFGDRVQIQQVLINLIMNSIQAMAGTTARSRELRIDMRATAAKFVEVSITDCGGGFPAEREGRIFEPFFSTKAEGMGLGLPICRSIVESHGGSIQARNNSLNGSVVTFTLPCSNQPHSAAAVATIS